MPGIRQRLPLVALMLLAWLSWDLPVLAAGEPVLIDVRTQGAVGDGTTFDTKALQAAIDGVAQSGGGIVRFPPGRYLSGSLELRSRVTLQLDRDAVLLGSPRREDYRRVAEPGTIKGRNFCALLLAYRLNDIAITGAGTIDGQGTALAIDVIRLAKAGTLPDAKEAQRPTVVCFTECTGVQVSGITIRDSACWVQEYNNCDKVRIEGVTVRSIAAENNDGIDIDGCSEVIVRHCDIDAEDDGICLKSYERPCRNVLVEHCRVRSSCNAIKLGTGSWKGFQDIAIQDCEVYDTYLSGIAIECVDGGRLEDVRVQRIAITGSHNAIFLRLGHRNVRGAPGTFRAVVLSDITAEIPVLPPGHMEAKFPKDLVPYRHAQLLTASITGLPDHPVEDITLRNITLTFGGIAQPGPGHRRIDQLDRIPECRDKYPEASNFGVLPSWGFYVRHATGLTLDHLTLRLQGQDYRPALVCDDVQRLTITQASIGAGGGAPPVVFKDVVGADLHGIQVPAGTTDPISRIGTVRDVRIR